MLDGTTGHGPPQRRRTAALALALAVFPVTTHAAVLREAVFDVVFTSPSDCQVTASFAITDADTIEHRLVPQPGAVFTVTAVEGPVTPAGDRLAVGRSPILRLQPSAPGEQRYRLRYQVSQPSSGKYRCPLWVPTTPSDGRSQGVTIRVTLPRGATRAAGTLPSFSWDDRGTARLGHIPGFIRVPFGMEESPAGAAGIDITRAMDFVAVAALAGATAMFAWRRRRR